MWPIIEERRLERASGNTALYNDAIEWFEAAANGRDYDPVLLQLILSVAAIHTTTDLLCQTLLDISQNPNIVQPLREEIARCLEDGGWTKTTLYNMKLLDSCIKESQRMKPLSMGKIELVLFRRH